MLIVEVVQRDVCLISLAHTEKYVQNKATALLAKDTVTLGYHELRSLFIKSKQNWEKKCLGFVALNFIRCSIYFGPFSDLHPF